MTDNKKSILSSLKWGRDIGISPDRLMAFTDGVFAIAITLLVLGLELPDTNFTSGYSLYAFMHSILPFISTINISFIHRAIFMDQHNLSAFCNVSSIHNISSGKVCWIRTGQHTIRSVTDTYCIVASLYVLFCRKDKYPRRGPDIRQALHIRDNHNNHAPCCSGVSSFIFRIRCLPGTLSSDACLFIIKGCKAWTG